MFASFPPDRPLCGIGVALAGGMHPNVPAGSAVTPRQFADLAAAIARHAEELSTADGPDDAALNSVWQRARACLRAWRKEIVADATPRLYAEFFAAELPIRVWCTAVAASGRSQSQLAGPRLASRLFTDLLELRCTALQALAADHGLTTAEAAAVDRFRRRCERWADVLLGRLARRTGVSDYTMRPERAADFAEGATVDPHGVASWPLILAGLRISLTPAEEFRGSAECPTAGPAAELAAAIFASFPPRAFTSEGTLRSPGVGRIARVVQEGTLSSTQKGFRKSPPVFEEDEEQPFDEPRPTKPISFASLQRRRRSG